MKLTSSGTAPGGKRPNQSAEALVARICADPTALRLLAQVLGRQLLNGGFAAQLVDAADQIAASHRSRGPGRRVAGTVATGTGAIVGPSAGQPCIAMVALNGSAFLTSCYVPPHVAPDLAAGQEVWVEPINGTTDYMVVAVRNFQSTPAATSAQSTANAAMPAAGGAFTGPITLPSPALLAAGTQLSGPYSYYGYATSTSVQLATTVPFFPNLTNVPTSLTLTLVYSSNYASGSLGAGVFTTNGALIWAQAAAANATLAFRGTWTTVGNTLLAVTSAGATFDHHCDGRLASGQPCDTIRRGIPLAELVRSGEDPHTPGAYGLAYTCPRCGQVECFNTGLDPVEALGANLDGDYDPHARPVRVALVHALQRAAGHPLLSPGATLDGRAAARPTPAS